MMDRRELIQRAAMLLGGAVSASAISGILAGCVSTPGAGEIQSFFTPEELSIATAMADQIIPKTDTPGALDAGVPNFMERMLIGYYQEKQRDIVRSGLRAVATDAAELGGKSFAELTNEQQVALMKEYDRLAYEQNRRNAADPNADQHFFRIMKELTILGFCTSEAGATKFLKYAPIPGPYLGDIPYSDVGRAWQS